MECMMLPDPPRLSRLLQYSPMCISYASENSIAYLLSALVHYWIHHSLELQPVGYLEHNLEQHDGHACKGPRLGVLHQAVCSSSALLQPLLFVLLDPEPA